MKGNRNSGGKGYSYIVRLLALVLAIVLTSPAVLVPQQAYAARKSKKGKVTYNIAVHNLNSRTVLRRGTKFRISYSATRTKKGVTKGTKVRFKSSNKKIATVSKKGVITAKRNGTVKITVYCKSKRRKKKTIKIRVANYAHNYYASDARWIAHRGLHTSAIENTAAAFYAAGQSGGFWGCECDIWETRHVSPSMPALPGLPEEAAEPAAAAVLSTAPEQTEVTVAEDADAENTVIAENAEQPAESDRNDASAEITDTEQAENADTAAESLESGGTAAAEADAASASDLPDVSGLKATVSSWPAAKSMDILKKADEVKAAWADYSEKTAGLTEDQLKQVHKHMLTESGDDMLVKLYDAYKWVCEYDSIDFAINHDPTFSRIWGNGNAVRDMSRDEIKSQLPGICFLAEYLDICKAYHMVPVIEFKDPYMSDEAINKALDMANERGLLSGAYLISFYPDILEEVKTQAAAKLGRAPVTYYLIADNGTAKVDFAKAKGFTGVSFSKSVINSSLYNRARSYGLGVGTWTYRDNSSNSELLYRHMYLNGWRLDFITVDYRIFL